MLRTVPDTVNAVDAFARLSFLSLLLLERINRTCFLFNSLCVHYNHDGLFNKAGPLGFLLLGLLFILVGFCLVVFATFL